MKSLESTGLTLERTGVGSDRELHTIRLKSAYVASICYSARTDQEGVTKAGYWSNVCLRPELNQSQLRVIQSHLKREMKRFEGKIFGGQK